MFTHSSPNLDRIQMSFTGEWINKLYAHIMGDYYKGEWTTDTNNSMYGVQKCYITHERLYFQCDVIYRHSAKGKTIAK